MSYFSVAALRFPMDTLIPAFLRRQCNQRRLTLEMLSAKVGMSRSICRRLKAVIATLACRPSSAWRRPTFGNDWMPVLIVPDAIAPDLRRYVTNNGRIYTTRSGQTAAAPHHPEAPKPDHAQEKT